MLGLKPLPARTPLKATITGKLERAGYTIEKLHFQSLPGLYVTANLYLPRPANDRYPAILYQVGHYNQHRRDGNKAAPDCQQQGIWFATHGYVVLVMDTLEFSEIAGAASRSARRAALVVAFGRLYSGGRRMLERDPRA